MELSHGQAVIRLRDITAELERLGAIDDPTEEQEQQFDELTREFGSVDTHRRKLEREASLARVRSAATATERVPAALQLRTERGSNEPGSQHGSDYDRDPLLNPDDVRSGRFRNPWDLSEVRTFSRSREEVTQELRSRALCAVEKMSGTNDKVRAAATAVLEQFDDVDGSIARMALATSSPEYVRAWSKVAMGRAHLVSPDEQRALERALSLTDAEGGYLVPFQLDPTLVLTSVGTRNPIRQISRKVVATGDVWNGVSASDVVWSWRPEEEEATDDSPVFAPLSIPNHKANGFVPISIEAMGDAQNITAEVGRLLARGKDTLEANALTTGTGVNQPTGIVTALVASSPTRIITAAGETFALADLYALDNALPSDHRAGAVYVANRSIFNMIRQFDTQGGANLWERIGNDVPGLLLGRPAYEAENMDGAWNPAVTGENYVMIYGDFENYVITDRIGMTVEFIPHLFGPTRRMPTGQRGWYAYYRVGADSVNDNAFRMLNVHTTL